MLEGVKQRARALREFAYPRQRNPAQLQSATLARVAAQGAVELVLWAAVAYTLTVALPVRFRHPHDWAGFWFTIAGGALIALSAVRKFVYERRALRNYRELKEGRIDIEQYLAGAFRQVALTRADSAQAPSDGEREHRAGELA